MSASRSPRQLETFVREGPGRELHGMSVTMPGKPEAFALAAETDDVSARLAISNTLIRRADGRWRAENHDVHGIAASLGDHGVHAPVTGAVLRSEEHTSELQSRGHLVCRLLLEKKT